MKVKNVFVYGTLKRGYYNHQIFMKNAVFLGEHKTEPNFVMYDGAFPKAYPGGTQSLEGEVFEIDEETLEGLDQLEGCPNFYTRLIIDTPYGPAWMYVILRYFDHWAPYEEPITRWER